jgi:hypothetical protein
MQTTILKKTKNENESNISRIELQKVSNFFNLKSESGYLHSKHDPVKEGDRFIQSLPEQSESVNIVAGLGWGYTAESLLKNLTESKTPVLFYEPIEEIQTILIRTGRLRELTGHPDSVKFYKIFFRLNELTDYISEHLSHKHKLNLIISPGYSHQFPDLIKTLEDRLLKKTSDSKSISLFGSLWLRNSAKLWDGGESPAFISKKKSGTSSPHLPLIFCGGGPGIIENLKNTAGPDALKSFSYILSSDTASGPVFKSGITPDAVISIDAGRGTLFHLLSMMQLLPQEVQKAQTFDFPVISWSAGSGFLHNFFKERLYYRSTFPLDEAISAEYPVFNDLPLWSNASRNMAGIALHIAKYLGYKEIYTAGSLFRSVNGQTHERGTGYEYYLLQRTNRLHSIENYSPGLYTDERTGFNKTSLSELNQMAESMEIKILPLEEPENRDQLRNKLIGLKIKNAPKSAFLSNINLEKNMSSNVSDFVKNLKNSLFLP